LDLRKEELIKQAAEGEEPKKVSNDDYIFCNRDGTEIGSLKKSFEALLKYTGLEYDEKGEKRTIYSLRHTYATFRLNEGVHQFVLAKNMGTSVAMLERHYGHTSNVASAAELTKGSGFKGKEKTSSIDWLEKI
jgi:integrase